MDTYIDLCYTFIVRWRRYTFILNTKEKQGGHVVEDKKKNYYTKAQKRAAEKYLKETVEDIRIRVPKGKKSIIKDHSTVKGESLNSFVNRAIDEAIERDNQQEGSN